MAAFNKFNVFTKDLVNGSHQFGTHTFKMLLTNTAPVAGNSLKGDLVEISSGNGYAAGGPAVTMTVSTASGVAKVTATDTTVTATGSVGPFQYMAIYNDSQTTPSKPLVGWSDYGSAITLSNTQTFTADFDNSLGLFTVT